MAQAAQAELQHALDGAREELATGEATTATARAQIRTLEEVSIVVAVEIAFRKS